MLATAALVLATTLGAVAVTAATTGQAGAAANSCGNVFDDFNYASSARRRLHRARLGPRAATPAVPASPGPTWSPANITFPTVRRAEGRRS